MEDLSGDNEILQQFQLLLQEILPEKAIQVRAEQDLMNDLALDSLKVMELLERLEDVYDISIPINILADVRTVADLAAAIEGLTNC
ncbi:MAG: acyl carrier protein [Desulfobulbaceae bacterium]|nr:acyl carrier protein [Desulfobulbaceae bacterium]